MVTLIGERLTLRPWTLDDVDAAFAIYADPEVMHFLGGEPVACLEEQHERLVKAIARFEDFGEPYGNWAMVDRDSRTIVGTALFKPLPGHEEVEIGWHIGREWWGNGYATEAGGIMIKYAFGSRGLRRLVSVVNPDNSRSSAVARRLGMRYEGRIRAYDQDVDLFVLEAESVS